MTVLTPDEFNKRFTLYINLEGKPVERALREMTGKEVLFAIKWHMDEAVRAERKAAPFSEMATILATGGNLPEETPGAVICEGIQVLRQAARASEKAARLLSLVSVAMPQWKQHKGMKIDEAVRRFWPWNG